MAARGDLPFPLVIACLVLMCRCAALPLPSDDDDVEDYDQLETPAPSKRSEPPGGTSERCAYDPCADDQTPCGEMRALTGCLCPGFTLGNVAPEAPALTSVSWNGSAVVARWCAPYSHVTAYVVTAGGEERRRFGSRSRSGALALGEAENIVEVCVAAENGAGDSEASCEMYRPPEGGGGGGGLALKAGLIGGALGLLLLVLLAALLWRRRRQRKRDAGISMGDAGRAQ